MFRLSGGGVQQQKPHDVLSLFHSLMFSFKTPSKSTFVFVFVITVPKFYSYTEGATWKILARLMETLLF